MAKGINIVTIYGQCQDYLIHKKIIGTMVITRSIKETIQARALRDKKFRTGLLKESIECMLAGDTETGKMILRDYINATKNCMKQRVFYLK